MNALLQNFRFSTVLIVLRFKQAMRLEVKVVVRSPHQLMVISVMLNSAMVQCGCLIWGSRGIQNSGLHRIESMFQKTDPSFSTGWLRP